MHPKQWAKVLGLVDSNGQPIVRLGMVQAGPPMSLMGRPVILTSAISVNVTRGSTGSTSNIYYGPPEKLYLGVRNGLRFDVTDQVNWASYAMDMRVVGRFGFAVAVPGAWTKLVGGTVD
jgi:HK97 family phage major capsid protein